MEGLGSDEEGHVALGSSRYLLRTMLGLQEGLGQRQKGTCAS